MKHLTCSVMLSGLVFPGVLQADEARTPSHPSTQLRLSAEAADLLGSDPWFEEGRYVFSQLVFGVGGVVELGSHLSVDVGARAGVSTGVFPVWSSSSEVLAPLSGARGDVQLDRASVGFEQLLQGQASITLGRQDVVLGSGLLVADGYRSNWETPMWDHTVPLEDTLPPDEESISAASLFLGGLNYWDGASVALDLDAWGAGGDLLIARASPGTVSNADIDQQAADAPTVVAADGHVAARDGEVGLTLLGTFLAEGFEFSSAARAELPVGENVGIQAELAAQLGREGETPLLANAMWVGASWQDDLREKSPAVGVFFHHFSGDKADTEDRDEAWRGRFYHGDGFIPGQVAGPAWLPQSDLDWFTLTGQVAPSSGHTLGVTLFTILAGRGSTLCQELSPGSNCISAPPAVAHTPIAEEVDLAWSVAPRALRGTTLGARGGLVMALPGGVDLLPTGRSWSLGLHASFMR